VRHCGRSSPHTTTHRAQDTYNDKLPTDRWRLSSSSNVSSGDTSCRVHAPCSIASRSAAPAKPSPYPERRTDRPDRYSHRDHATERLRRRTGRKRLIVKKIRFCAFSCGGWQLTLRDSIWQVALRNFEVCLLRRTKPFQHRLNSTSRLKSALHITVARDLSVWK